MEQPLNDCQAGHTLSEAHGTTDSSDRLLTQRKRKQARALAERVASPGYADLEHVAALGHQLVSAVGVLRRIPPQHQHGHCYGALGCPAVRHIVVQLSLHIVLEFSYFVCSSITVDSAFDACVIHSSSLHTAWTSPRRAQLCQMCTTRYSCICIGYKLISSRDPQLSPLVAQHRCDCNVI